MDSVSIPIQQPLLTNDQILRPLNNILQEVTTQTPSSLAPSRPLSQSIQESLDSLFPEQQYDEKDIQKAKDILGPLSKELSPDQLKNSLSEIEFLVESWLDDYERQIFEGQTLQEMLHEKGSK